jgi:hypothetical protein
LRKVIHRDAAGEAELDAHRFEAESCDVGATAGREHHLVDQDLLVV